MRAFLIRFADRHHVFLLLFAVLALAFVLRAWGLNNNPFIADEFIDMNASYGFFKTGEWHAWDFNLEKPDVLDFYAARDERSWIYRWQVVQLFRFLPPTEVVARSVSVFWGLMTVLIVFWSACVFTQKTSIALLAAFLFAVSIDGIEYDRKLRMYAMFAPVFLAFSTWLFLFLQEKTKTPRQKKSVPSGGKPPRLADSAPCQRDTTPPRGLGTPPQAGNNLDSFPSMKGWRAFGAGVVSLKNWNTFFGVHLPFLLPALLAGLLALHLQLLTVNIVFSLFGYFFAVAILSRFFPHILSFSKSAKWGLGTFVLGAFLAYIFFPEILLSISGTSKFFMDNYDYLGKIFNDFQHPLLGALVVLFGFRTLFFTMKKPKNALWLLTSFLVPLLLTIFVWKRAQGTQYVFYLEPFVLILAATGVAGCLAWLQKNIPTVSKKTITLVVFSLAVLLLPNYGYYFQEQNTYHRGNDPVADYRKVFLYLGKLRTPGDALITRNFRNYYFPKWHAPVLEFGGERADHDLTREEIQNFICTHPSGFVVMFDNDWNFVTKDGRAFVESTLQKIDHSSVRGSAEAWRWDGGKGCSE